MVIGGPNRCLHLVPTSPFVWTDEEHDDSPIGGHIRAENCRAIAFVARPFMGRASCSIQFFNEAGEAMFKIFVRRNAARELIPEQVQKFEALRARIREAAGGGR